MENRQENETEGSKLPVENHEKGGSTQGAGSVSGRPRRFGRGIYDKTDTPIRLFVFDSQFQSFHLQLLGSVNGCRILQ